MSFNKKFLSPIFITLLSLALLLPLLQKPEVLVFAQESSLADGHNVLTPVVTISPEKIKNLLMPNAFQGDLSLTPLILNSILNKVVIILLIASSVIFFFMVIVSGIRWMTAGGDKEKITGAKQQLTSAAIGLTITLLVFTIANLIKLLFGVNLLQFTIPTL